jgi:hypothetical protein
VQGLAELPLRLVQTGLKVCHPVLDPLSVAALIIALPGDLVIGRLG